MADKKKKKTCFIIGPIGSAGSQTRTDADFLLDGIIKEVLEKEPFNYDVKRADKDVSPGSINSAVINDIINADLAIADLSEHNPNAFYELGIRHAFNKPVIHMIREGETIPFDNLDQRCIFFSTASWSGVIAARKTLTEFVKNVNSPGYRPSNPVTQAATLHAMVVAGDKEGVIINSLQEKINYLEKNTEKLISIVSSLFPQINSKKENYFRSYYSNLSKNINEHKIINNSNEKEKNLTNAILAEWQKTMIDDNP